MFHTSSPSTSSSSSSYSSTSFTSFAPSQSSNSNLNQVNKSFKRSKAIQELILTESIYSSDLIIIRDVYLYRSTGPPPSSPPLSNSDRQIIFSNISQLCTLAQSLASELVIANENNSIGQCFIQFLPKIEKLYTIYCSKYETANKKLDQLNKKINSKQKKLRFSSPTYNSINSNHHQQQQQNDNKDNEHPGVKYLRECKSLCEGRTTAWDLGSLLIKPVQRCLKYSLLLDQIINFTDLDHPDRQNLILAREGMIDVADKINEAKRRNELVGEMINRTGPITAMHPAVLLAGQQNSHNMNKWSIPTELNKLITQVKRSNKSLIQLPGDVRNLEYSFKNYFLSADRLTTAFKSVLNSRNANFSDHSPYSIFNVSDMHRYQQLVLQGALNGPLRYLHDKIELEIIPKINELKELYKKPMILIDKYEKRRQLMMSVNYSPRGNSVTEVTSPRSSQSSSTVSSSNKTSTSTTSTCTSHDQNSTINNKMIELEHVESFLLDQLPKMIHLSHLSLYHISADLAHYSKLFHFDLMVLIKKVAFTP